MGDSHLWVACGFSALVTALLIAVLRPFARPLGLVDLPSYRKHHIGAIPLIGGLAMFGGIVVGNLLYGQVGPFRAVIIETAALMAFIGALDDRHDLSVRLRLVAQVGCVLCVVISTGVYVKSLGHLFGYSFDLGALGIPFTVVAVIGLVNAFNMMDGIDGLTGSQALVSVITLLLFHGGEGLRGMTAMLATVGAAALPYLVVNLGLTGRKVFLGDAGSMVIGYLLAWALIRLSQAENSPVSPVDVLWCVGVPTLDTVTVMGRRLLERKSPFKPDRGHIHHLLMARGLTARQALLALFAMSCLLSCIGMVTTNLSAGSNLLAFAAVASMYVTFVLREHRRGAIAPRAAAAVVAPAPVTHAAAIITTNEPVTVD